VKHRHPVAGPPWWAFICVGIFGALVSAGLWWAVLMALDVRYIN